MDQPGVAIGVIKDGKVVFARGWGLRTLGDPAPVDEHTLFQVASNTKAVTAAALAILIKEGKLHWDDPVTDYLPWFRLGGDPYVSREMTVRDLLTHRSGLSLGAGDLLWFHSDRTREEIARQLRYIAPTASFRSRYAYDNVLFIVAGLVVEAASGMKWDEFVRTRIFEPIGMTETGTDIGMFRPGTDAATPHGRVDGRMQIIPRDSVENTGPAGGINSTVTDWLKWQRVQMDSGRVDADQRLWGEAETFAMWSPGIALPTGNPPAPFMPLRANFAAYGLGWFLRDYRGYKIVYHDGGLAGMLSRAFMVPDKKLGVVVLTNGETSAYQALAWYVLDYYLGAPKTDWVGVYATAEAGTIAADKAFEDSAAANRKQDVGPSLPLDRLAGRYADAWYGDVTVAVEDGHLVLHWSRSPALVADLEHWQYDTFRARMRVRNVADAFVTFQLKPNGTVDRLVMVPVLPSTDFSFNYQDLLFHPVP
jgi:CubicO group peptidase (beta-lactamase class C family)